MAHGGFPILTPYACGVERYAEGKESAEGMSHLMERVKYTQSYEGDTNPFWYTEFAVIQHSICKLHDRKIQEDYTKALRLQAE